MFKYERVIYYSTDDNCWIVEVPELAGCQSDGITIQEALSKIDVVIGEWVSTAVSLGRTIPDPIGRFPFK